MPNTNVTVVDLFNEKIYQKFTHEFLKYFEAHELVNHIISMIKIIS
jgi:hypothetical protein